MIEIKCDLCGRTGVASESSDFARQQSKKLGFRYFGGLDQWKCPNCLRKEKLEEQKAKQSAKPKSSYKIPRVSEKKKELDKEYYRLRDIEIKKHPFCAMLGCTKLSTDCHHSKGREGNNMLDVSTWVFLCHKHHMEVENMTFAEAESLGMKQSRHWSWETKDDSA